MSRVTIGPVARVATVALAALGSVAATSSAARAASADGSERPVEAICVAMGGTLVNNPFQLVRCQQVPTTTMREPLLRVGELLCERQLDRSFSAAPSFGGVDGSITWICT